MKVKKIDIHVHATLKKGMPRKDGGGYFATAEEIRRMYDAWGIEKGVQLPSCISDGSLGIVTNEMSMELVEKHPDTFYWFCNLDPRWDKNSPETDFSYMIEYYKQYGAKGVGEVTANLYFDDPRVENLFYHCERCGMPLTFHIGDMGGDYGLVDELGLPRLERALRKFPKLQFLGHSQKFWAEISGDVTPEVRNGYPEGPVVPGGRVVELMRSYPNLCGDLSAGSGQNALMRDPEFGYRFLEEFQDRLYFGTDICDPRNVFELSFFLDDAVENGHISQTCYEKVSRGNALKLLNRPM